MSSASLTICAGNASSISAPGTAGSASNASAAARTVTAVDCVELDTFLEARHLLKSKVEYLTLDVNELSARRLGRFDIVLFFGVLYHLRHPLLGLEKAVELSTDLVLIESFVIESETDRPIPAVMEFYERAELGGQIDNWCGPTPECSCSLCAARRGWRGWN